MIWTAPISHDPDREAMESHLAGHLSAAYPDRANVPDCLPAVAAAITDVWEHDLARSPLPADLLPLLASRALWRIGEHEAARGLVKESSLGELVENGGPTLSACAHLATKVMRPEDSAMGGDGPSWSLDVDRLGAAPMELALFQRVRAALEQVAEVWDADRGRGALLIRSHTEVPELTTYVRALLALIRDCRGWAGTPSIMWLGRA